MGYSINKYNFKKRIFFKKKLIDLGTLSKFKIIEKDACGPYLQVGYNFTFFNVLNYILDNLSNIYIFNFFKKFGESQIIIFKK